MRWRFQIGSALLPGEQVMPVFHHAAASAGGWLPPWEWVGALGWPVVVGLPVMGCWFALNGYLLFTWWWLRPVVARMRRIRNRTQRPV